MIFLTSSCQSKISKQSIILYSINELCDTFFTFDLFLLWCSQNFDTAASYKHDRYSRVLKTITVLLLYIYYCSFSFLSLTFSPPFLKQSRQILFEKLKQDWCFTITISIFNYSKSPRFLSVQNDHRNDWQMSH